MTNKDIKEAGFTPLPGEAYVLAKRKRLVRLLEENRRMTRGVTYLKSQMKRRMEKVGLLVDSGDIVIDCGANIGDVTELFSDRGAEVYAFEPNPHAFSRLEERFQGRQNVHCLAKGVLDAEETTRLFFHRNAGEDPLYWSAASSILEGKSNIDPGNYAEVSMVDLSHFITGLGRRVRVLKLDVEGAECRILNHLITLGTIDLIDHVFVETHEDRVPTLLEETNELRRRLRNESINHVNLDWV